MDRLSDSHRLAATTRRLQEETARGVELQAMLFAAQYEIARLEAQLSALGDSIEADRPADPADPWHA